MEVSFTRALLGSKGFTRARPGLISHGVLIAESAPALPHMGLSVKLELTWNIKSVTKVTGNKVCKFII